MKTRGVLVLGLGAALLVGACDDTSTGTGGATASSGSTTGSSVSSSSGGDMCIKSGDPGNDIGIGAFCTPGGGECQAYPLASLCLADVGQDEHFCTRIGCDATTNCGMGAGCLIEGAGSACVPCKCDDAGVGCGTTTTASSGSSSGSSSSSGSAASSSSGG